MKSQYSKAVARIPFDQCLRVQPKGPIIFESSK